MKSNWKKFISKALVNAVGFFVVYCILDWLFGREKGYGEIALMSIVYGLIIVPVINKTFKDK